MLVCRKCPGRAGDISVTVNRYPLVILQQAHVNAHLTSSRERTPHKVNSYGRKVTFSVRRAAPSDISVTVNSYPLVVLQQAHVNEHLTSSRERAPYKSHVNEHLRKSIRMSGK